MIKLLIIILLPILFHFPYPTFTQENADPGNPGSGNIPIEERKSSNSSLLEEDGFSFLHIDEATLCLLVSEEDIPPSELGKLGYEENCDPDPRKNEKCNLFTKELSPVDSTKECLKPTHLLCDPVSRKCLCSFNNKILDQIRFQVGTKDGKNSQGRCFIRPTFDVIQGFDCAPGSDSAEVAVSEDDNENEDDEMPAPYCQCKNTNETEKFDTSDPQWWDCNGGSRIQITWNHIVAFLALRIYLFTLFVNTVSCFVVQ